MEKIPHAAFLKIYFRSTGKLLLACFFLFFSLLQVLAHPITGVWRGEVQCGKGAKKITSTIEVKLVGDGTSIVGTIYYLGTGKNYIRYSIKGSFWGPGNSIYWQDYAVININVKKSKDVHGFSETMKYFADYNNLDENSGKLLGYCMLDKMPQMTFVLEKVKETFFPDEWDAVIDGHYAGINSKELLDSVWAIASEPMVTGAAGMPSSVINVRKIAEINQPDSILPGSSPGEDLPSPVFLPENFPNNQPMQDDGPLNEFYPPKDQYLRKAD
jgi:hypothetical protein